MNGKTKIILPIVITAIFGWVVHAERGQTRQDVEIGKHEERITAMEKRVDRRLSRMEQGIEKLLERVK